MSILSRLTNYATYLQARRQRIRTYMQIAELPPEIRKDIGWTLSEEPESAPRIRRNG